MASINYAAREINVKIVYYGPGLSGKTTNLQVIHKKVPPEYKSDMVSLATETDRTLFFDFLPLDLGKIKGFSTKFQLYTVPGQVYYNATRKLVLRGVDGVVFVADSAQDKIEENIESFQNLENNLAEYGYKRENIPTIIQYNKRDLPNALPVEELEQYVNKYRLPWSEAVANKGIGVFDSLKLIGKMVIDYLNKKYSRGSRPAAAPPQQQVPQFQSRQAGMQTSGQPQQRAPSPYNQLGQPPQHSGRPPFQGGAGQPQQRAGYPQPPIRQPSLPPAQIPLNRGSGQRQLNQQPMRQPQAYMQQQQYPSAVPSPGPHYQPRKQQQAPESAPPMRHPVPADEYSDHVTFEPRAPGSPAPQRGAPAQDEYYSYGSINLEPMDTQNQSGMGAPQDQYAVFDQHQNAASRQGYDSSGGKTELDLEIERYQREIEEKQHRTRGPVSHATPPAPYTPAKQPAQQRPAVNQDNAQQEYEVYNMESPAYGAQQQQPVQPIIGSNGEEEMFFTSVDTDRQKKPAKRPVNPRTQQQKGFLSKFFNKDMS
ncbi:MAG: hypothetical protein JXA18_02545 [Chitinispirillaceae bacterium]|nr:hypothetical protein [Chitinispirillaceae bacterium]